MFKEEAVPSTTFEYDKFKLLSNNRVIKVKKSLRDELINTRGNVSPIVVDKHGYIYDGQHRWLVCKEEGLALSYVVESKERLDKVSPKILNASMTNWKTNDFIDSSIKDGNHNFTRLRTLALIGKITPAAVYSALFNRPIRSSKDLMEGTLIITKKH